jgi:hypothetical protein
MRRPPRLVPLGARLPDQQAEARIRQAWPFLVGPALTDCTRPLRLHRGVLVMGCWDLTRIAALRDSIEVVWPQLRARIQRALRLELMGLQVQPCDPPPPTQLTAIDPDPLRRALTLLLARRQERQQLGRLPQDDPLDDHPQSG